MVRISELELEWSLVQFELHLELGFFWSLSFLVFDFSSKLYFVPLILNADWQPILTKSLTLERFSFTQTVSHVFVKLIS